MPALAGSERRFIRPTWRSALVRAISTWSTTGAPAAVVTLAVPRAKPAEAVAAGTASRTAASSVRRTPASVAGVACAVSRDPLPWRKRRGVVRPAREGVPDGRDRTLVRGPGESRGRFDDPGALAPRVLLRAH